MCLGSGSWTSTPSTLSSALSFSTSATSAASEMSAGKLSSKEASPAAAQARAFGPHIDLAGRIASDKDRGKTGGHIHLVTQTRRDFGDAAT